MKNKIINVIGILLIISIVLFVMWLKYYKPTELIEMSGEEFPYYLTEIDPGYELLFLEKEDDNYIYINVERTFKTLVPIKKNNQLLKLNKSDFNIVKREFNDLYCSLGENEVIFESRSKDKENNIIGCLQVKRKNIEQTFLFDFLKNNIPSKSFKLSIYENNEYYNIDYSSSSKYIVPLVLKYKIKKENINIHNYIYDKKYTFINNQCLGIIEFKTKEIGFENNKIKENCYRQYDIK